jgi:amino acid permease
MKNKAKFDQLPSSEYHHDDDGGRNGLMIAVTQSLDPVDVAPLESNTHVLHRSLSFFDGLGIIVGIIIGSGIFSSPGLALERSGSPGACLLAWAVSGMLVCLTSQCYFELGSMMPTAGISKGTSPLQPYYGCVQSLQSYLL